MAAKNLRQFEFKLGKLGIALFLVGFTILVFTGFLLGVQVGRNLDSYPDWIARGIPRHILDIIGPHGSHARRDIPVGKPGGALFEPPAGASQAQAARPAEGDAAPSPAVTPAAGNATQATEASATSGDGAAAPPQDAQESAAKKAAPAVVPDTSKKEKALPEAKKEDKKEKDSPPKSGRFAVQVVSFREKEKAEALSKKIKSLGYAPEVAQADVTGKGKWFRVTVEGFDTKQAAEKAAENMTSKIKGLNCVIKGK